ncbi:hypothetical protein Btru_058701 [Bulinus truncatus]|nr:hypothetical protein Btru_058701 [Bulinus truncatus]
MGIYFKKVLLSTTRWVVLDDITTPCNDVSTYTQQDGWAVVIVTDKEKDIKGCRLPTCFQLSWGYVNAKMSHLDTHSLLSKQSKLSGYLFAMQHGAKVILDAECSFQLEDITKTFCINESHQSGLLYNDKSVFNPYPHFGIHDAFPKEMRLMRQNNNSQIVDLNSGTFHMSEWSSVPIRLGVTISPSTCVRLSPDAINKQNVFPHGPPVSVVHPGLAPFSTGPTVFYEDVFMLLFIPSNLLPDAGKLFRSIWFHQLNRLSLITSAFYFRHNKSEQMQDCARNEEMGQFNASLDSLYNCLGQIVCNQSECMAPILKQLSFCFYKEIFTVAQHVNFSEQFVAWKSDLLKLGFNVSLNSTVKVQQNFRTKYVIPKQLSLFQNISSSNEATILKDAISLCGVNETSNWKSLQRMSNPSIDDIALIVVFNYEFVFKALGINEFIHRQYFKYIIYCVPSLHKFENFTKNTGFDYVTFIDGLADGWIYYFECVSAAMNLNLPVKGYLQIGEDVLLNDWNLATLPRDEMMLYAKENYLDLYKDDRQYPWVHWNSHFGQPAVKRVFEELKNAPLLSLEEQTTNYPRVNISHFAATFMSNLEGNIKPNFIAYGSADIFYVPQRLSHEYITATKLFRKHECMVELALRIIYHGLQTPGEQKFYFEGHELWGMDRVKSWRLFDAHNETFIHPFKWIKDAHTDKGRRFACERYFPLL